MSIQSTLTHRLRKVLEETIYLIVLCTCKITLSHIVSWYNYFSRNRDSVVFFDNALMS